ncbi:MAG: hypothetical protein Q9194_002118 [Teloschistes cf. exilis]
MAPPRGSAAYKKQDGTLAISRDGQHVSWTPVTPPGSKPALNFAVSTITNLQQTPANNPKEVPHRKPMSSTLPPLQRLDQRQMPSKMLSVKRYSR